MYADHMTDSMHPAMTETERRREIQDEYNKEHGITPQTIKKDIRDLIKISDEHEEETGGYEKDMESMSKKELKEVTSNPLLTMNMNDLIQKSTESVVSKIAEKQFQEQGFQNYED